jgi:hypothetical protein
MDGGNSGGSRINICRAADCNVKLYFYLTYASFASFFLKISWLSSVLETIRKKFIFAPFKFV